MTLIVFPVAYFVDTFMFETWNVADDGPPRTLAFTESQMSGKAVSTVIQEHRRKSVALSLLISVAFGGLLPACFLFGVIREADDPLM